MITLLAHQKKAAANTLKYMGQRWSLLNYAPKQTFDLLEICDQQFLSISSTLTKQSIVLVCRRW